MSKVTARWVPKLLSKEPKRERFRVSKGLLSRYKEEEDFLDRIVTGDEIWFIIMNKRTKLNRSSGRCDETVPIKTMAAIDDLGFECLPHPPYSPDLAPSDYWLFGEMKRFEDFKWLEYEIKQWEKGPLKNSIPLGWKSYQNDGNDV
ncbi:hypothetical protein LOD99_8210 [Oopsacas minuta]|uniref:Transposase n=1 Tax=Oopsacas minuta TaxID=111878 RepID=A0AAV7JHS1_9METZ|nr:hypothetical protein LOD99_8210 [Oopsacas minuta]